MAETSVRQAARVLLLDDVDAVLLLRGFDPAAPDAGRWWFTPGGGLEPGESAEQAARREVREETGLALGALGPVVHERTAEFVFDGVHYRQREVFFVARVSRFDPSPAGRTELEVRALLDARWWTMPDLDRTSETVYPEDLAALLTRIRP